MRRGLIILPLLGFIVVASIIPGLLPRKGRPQTHDMAVFVADNGVHTDLIVPLRGCGEDWTRLLPQAGTPDASRPVTHVAFGWGARDFYLSTPTWDDVDPVTALKSLLFAPTVLHVESIRGTPATTMDVRRVWLDAEGCHTLARFIRTTLAPDRQGRAIRVDHPGYGPDDTFFEATGRFSPFRTCNTWTAEALAAAGVTSPLWTAFAWGVMRHLPQPDDSTRTSP
ncbi:TIGR02117 family protein [Nitratidesulfovibrio vulgaris]|uniref:TIGR02117 family protein n=1 Tax=Nitratidesulfovibrio vulgaris (strain ATCC 29579 / DSM 644 / CCUG 34227 / NCIMB 8303 / VKM B-1760 / Hildenborough) TaxID=882 RepID=Q72E52_NITV2|nr:TIGR02117 family protein [Nitratidesulfovibrio vulgaris]AAS95207.1 conserved hypothetical protein [Nitratidesulfovibrio vulgaris str. Hildenborough]ADP85833.1 Conserved hypothetical protein CHP02117 [Nitratidesulfovibrio vulgaris RCH1]